METCKYGLGASTRKPPTARWVWRWVLSPHEKENNKTITPEQIEAWKKKWGDVFCVTVGDKVAYLKRPSRQALSAAAVVGKNDPMKYNEILLGNCWLAGDEEIKTDDSLFLGVSAKLGELVEMKEAELKKL